MTKYMPTNWQDSLFDEEGNRVQIGTSLSAANLNKIEQGVKVADDKVDVVQTAISGLPKRSEFDAVTQQLADTAETIEQFIINIRQPPYNAVAGTDVTAVINQAISDASGRGGGKVFIPLGTYRINAITSIQMKSNVTLELADNAVLEAIPNSSGLYAVIKGTDVSNIAIVGRGKIKGERQAHTGSSGEWGMGIDLRGCTNVFIDKLTITDCWGDAIYIANSTTKDYCENVTIDGVLADNNRRQGISVISAKNLRILNYTAKNTLGTSPQAGIDIEPNFPTHRLEGIFIENYISENNVYGLSIWLTHMVETQNTIDIFVKNFTDNGSTVGVRITTSDAFSGTNVVAGNIIFDGVSLNNNKRSGIFSIAYPINLPQVHFKNVLIKDSNSDGGTSHSVNSAISIIRQSDSTSTSPVGNIKIENFSIVNKHKMPIYSIYVYDALSLGMGGIEFINPTKIDKGSINYFYNGGSVNFEDKYRSIEHGLASSGTNYPLSYFTNWSNKSAASPKTITLSDDIKIGSSFTLRIEKPLLVTILTGSSEILPIGNGIGKSVSSAKVGSKIKLKKVSSTQYFVEEMIGMWESQV